MGTDMGVGFERTLVLHAPVVAQGGGGTIVPAAVGAQLFEFGEEEILGAILGGIAERLEQAVADEHGNVVLAVAEEPGGFENGQPSGKKALGEELKFLGLHRSFG